MTDSMIGMLASVDGWRSVISHQEEEKSDTVRWNYLFKYVEQISCWNGVIVLVHVFVKRILTTHTSTVCRKWWHNMELHLREAELGRGTRRFIKLLRLTCHRWNKPTWMFVCFAHANKLMGAQVISNVKSNLHLKCETDTLSLRTAYLLNNI